MIGDFFLEGSCDFTVLIIEKRKRRNCCKGI
jgi:hypothetical protein